MISEFRVALDGVRERKVFKDFIVSNPDAYLVSGFFMVENPGSIDAVWQADFFSPSTYKITSFVFSDPVEVKEDQDVFQKEKAVLDRLEVEKVNVGFRQCLDIVNGLLDQKYPGELPSKIIVVLQQAKGSPIWNITYLTGSFKIINVKINAMSGNIISDSIESVLSLGV